jgi:hypothetical protein
MKKIKICAGWDTPENILDRLLKQFKTPDIDLTQIDFVFDESYDTIVFFNYMTQSVRDGAKGYVFPHEPTFSGSHQKNFNESVTVFGFDSSFYNVKCVETVAHTFYGGRGPWMDPLEFWSFDNLSKFKTTKNKNISSSITSLNQKLGENCLYPERYAIAELINELDFVEVYGGWKNSPKRHDALVDYKFNISIENEYQKNWISEKFYDCILTDTIPIYFGCKNVKEIYPEDGYILIEDINDLEEIKKLLIYINDNSDKIYSEKIEGLRKIKNRYFSEYNPLKKIIQL